MIYDCFIFYNELDILEIRLHTLAPVVDRFILVESPETISGRPKPLYFAENKDRFSEFNITHIVARMSSPADGSEPSGFRRENEQRDAAIPALQDVRATDLVLMGDVDEIPFPETIREIRHNSAYTLPEFNYYNFRCFTQQWCIATAAVFGRDLMSPSQARQKRYQMPKIDGKSWHFSSFGGPDELADKLSSFTHLQYGTPEWTNKRRISRLLEEDKDFLGREQFPIVRRFNTRLPDYVMEHELQFMKWLDP